MSQRFRHDQLKNEIAHALVRLPQTRVWEIEPFRGRDEKGIYRNAGLRLPGASAAGALDLLCVSQGRCFFFDVKTGLAKLSEDQRRFIKVVQAAQGYAGECRAVEDAIKVVTNG